MQFIPKAHVFAANEMEKIDPELKAMFADLVLYISINNDLAPKSPKKDILLGSQEYITYFAKKFSSSRLRKAPKAPSTVPDEMVSEILHIYFDIPREQLDEVKHLHSLSMGAENIVGDLLERYIASIIEPEGWIWCSGSTVVSVDFIKPPVSDGDNWITLQVKNRSNSENSSSVKVRKGTEIRKWHRTNARTGAIRWDKFPCVSASNSLNETDFIEFVREYLLGMK